MDCPRQSEYKGLTSDDVAAGQSTARTLKSGFSKASNYRDVFECHVVQAACRILAVPRYVNLRSSDTLVDPDEDKQPAGVGLSFYNHCEVLGPWDDYGPQSYSSDCYWYAPSPETGGAAQVCGGDAPEKRCGRCPTLTDDFESGSMCRAGTCMGRRYWTTLQGDFDAAGTCPALALDIKPQGPLQLWWNDAPMFQANDGTYGQGRAWCAYLLESGEQCLRLSAWQNGASGDAIPTEALRHIISRRVIRDFCDAFAASLFSQPRDAFKTTDKYDAADNADPVSFRSQLVNGVYDKTFRDREACAPPASWGKALKACAVFPEVFVEGGDYYIYLPVYTSTLYDYSLSNGQPTPRNYISLPKRGTSRQGILEDAELNAALNTFLGDEKDNDALVRCVNSGDMDARFQDQTSIFVRFVAQGIKVVNADLASFSSCSGPECLAKPDASDPNGFFVVARVYKCAVQRFNLPLWFMFKLKVMKSAAFPVPCCRPNDWCSEARGENCKCPLVPLDCFETYCQKDSPPSACADALNSCLVSRNVAFPGLWNHVSGEYVLQSLGFKICTCQTPGLAPLRFESSALNAAQCFSRPVLATPSPVALWATTRAGPTAARSEIGSPRASPERSKPT